MKLKKLLNENLWNERKFGEPLPTLADTTKAYKLKQEDLNENDLSKVSSILGKSSSDVNSFLKKYDLDADDLLDVCLLYTSPSPRDLSTSRMPSSA